MNEIAFKTIKLIIKELERSLSFIKTQYRVSGSKSDPYYFINNAFYVRREDIEHAIYFKGFEQNFINSFILLYKNIFETDTEGKNSYQEFAFRTLHDLSFIKASIILNPEFDTQNKDLYKLLTILDDFIYVYETNPLWLEKYKKLLKEKEKIFSENQKTKINEIFENLEKKNFYIANDIAKKLLSASENSLRKEIKTPTIFNDDRLKLLYKGFSKLIHGDIPSLIDLFSGDRTGHLIFRKTYILLSTGLNILYLISKSYPELKVRIDEIQENYMCVYKELILPQK